MTSQIFKLLFSAQGKYKTFTDQTHGRRSRNHSHLKASCLFYRWSFIRKNTFQKYRGYFLLLQYHEWPLGKNWTQVAPLYQGPREEQVMVDELVKQRTFIQVTKARVAMQNSLLYCWCILRLIVCLYFPCFVRFRQQNFSVWFKKMSSLC